MITRLLFFVFLIAYVIIVAVDLILYLIKPRVDTQIEKVKRFKYDEEVNALKQQKEVWKKQ